MKRLFAGMTAMMLAVVLVFSAQGLSAQSAIAIDANTGRVYYSKNADQQRLIASTTKIMTALVICEQCNVLDRVRIPKEAVGVEGSSMYLQEGEVLTVQELLYGLMLRSGNDAAQALAIYCAGTVEGFAQLMNDKAHSLGLENTHFENPHGLDSPGHYSTAADLAKLTAYAMENPVFRQTVSTKTVSIGQRVLKNHNKLLWQVDGADGVKTGFTKAAGRILVSSATRQGRRLVVVTMNAPDDWNDHRILLEQGFSQYSPKTLVKQGDLLGTTVIAGGQESEVQLLAAEDFSYAVADGERIEILPPKKGFVYAPIAEAQDAGYAHVCINGVPVGKVQLVYGQTIEIEPEQKQGILSRIRKGLGK